MVNLIKKDFTILGFLVFRELLYIPAIGFAFYKFGGLAYLMAIFFYTYAVLMDTFNKDDKNDSEKIINCLPVKKADIIKAKYSLILIFILIGNVVFFILNYILGMLPVPYEQIQVSIPLMLMATLYIVVFNSICFPAFFKLGKNRAKQLDFVLFFMTFFGLPIIKKQIADPNFSIFEKGIGVILSMSQVAFSILTILLTLIVLSISAFISLKLYTNREF